MQEQQIQVGDTFHVPPYPPYFEAMTVTVTQILPRPPFLTIFKVRDQAGQVYDTTAGYLLEMCLALSQPVRANC